MVQAQTHLSWDKLWLSAATASLGVPVASSVRRTFEYNTHGSNPSAEAVANPVDEWLTIQTLVERVQELETQLRKGAGGTQEELDTARNRLADELRPRVHRMVWRIMWRIVRDSDSAEDITQKAMIQILSSLGNYDRYRAPFRCWAARIVIHTVYHELKDAGRIRSREISESVLMPIGDFEDEETPSVIDETPAPDVPPMDEVIAKERLKRILDCVQGALSTDEYFVWFEHIINGSAYSEIATLLKRREDWVRQTLHRAREKAAAAIVLDPRILSNEEIDLAIERCQQSENRLSDAELEVLRQSLRTNPRQPPGWRSINLFRQACLKVLPYVL